MTVQQIYDFFDRFAPFSTALPYDNSGLLVGDSGAQVHTALCCLDCTEEAIKKAGAIGAELIISHHPLIFDPLRHLLSDHPVYALAQAGIALLCVHTNFDLAPGGMNDLLAAQLDLVVQGGFSPVLCEDEASPKTSYLGRMAVLREAMQPEDFAAFVGSKLKTPVRFVSGGKAVTKTALIGGSGGKYLFDAIAAGADAFLTSEIDHHVFLAAAEKNITLVDAGHEPTERIFSSAVAGMLQKAFPAGEFVPFTHSPVQTR